MELIKQHWKKENGEQFQKYLMTFSKGKEKSVWEQRIVNTQLPCIAVPSQDVKKMVKEIAKGNFIEFLDLWLWENWTNTSVNGHLICKIKDFDLMVRYLDKYANFCDNWATCDVLKFPVKENNKASFFALSQRYIKSTKPFVRRLGIVILFKFIEDNNYIEQIFETINSFKEEDEYYVNMANAWLIAECFIKQREKTSQFLKNHNLNKFTINKAISKCRDSFRVSEQDKENLLKYKIQFK